MIDTRKLYASPDKPLPRSGKVTRVGVVRDILTLIEEAMREKNYKMVRIYADVGRSLFDNYSYVDNALVPVYKPEEVTDIITRIADTEAAILQFPSLAETLQDALKYRDWEIQAWFSKLSHETEPVPEEPEPAAEEPANSLDPLAPAAPSEYVTPH